MPLTNRYLSYRTVGMVAPPRATMENSRFVVNGHSPQIEFGIPAGITFDIQLDLGVNIPKRRFLHSTLLLHTEERRC